MLKNSHQTSFNSSNNKSLSILLSSDGFSFCINDTLTKENLFFREYIFEEKIDAVEYLLSKVLNIFENDKELQQDFSEIKVVHQNKLATLVPEDFFDENNPKIYLDYNIKTLPNDYVTFDRIKSTNIANAYIPFVNINNYLLDNFNEFEFKHHSTVLIEKLIELETPSHNSNKIYVNVAKNFLDIIVVDSGKLLFYNSFDFFTKEDFTYYILFVAEQLEVNTESLKLILLGKINNDDDNYKLIYQYIKNIEFIKTESTFFDSSSHFLNHNNFILIS